MQRTRTTSTGGTYVASGAPPSSPPQKHHSLATTNYSATNYSAPSTASTVSAAQYNKPSPKHSQRSPRGGTPGAPRPSATGTIAAPAAAYGQGERAGAAPDGFTDDADAAQYTFYREGTPTPSERSVETRWEKRGRHVSRRVSRRMGVVLSSVGFPVVERAEDHGRRAPAENNGARERRRRICGIAPGMFWCLVIGVGMVVIGLAVGLGLGLGLKSGGDKAEAASASNSPTPTASSTVPTITPTDKPSTFNIQCPESDTKSYLVPKTSKVFTIGCGIDYSNEKGGTVELGVAPALTVAACIEKCAATEGCTACGWGTKEGEDQDRCWLKGRLGTDHQADPGWIFATLQQ
ncbi:uncharacterized protein DNG_08856 [Cephalotrichum gorgonifer]|uniref:Apple domain-containing protein n=1 Tax=Cephalotrichum gorgonifer TaxID=2041049 RepID=A0AAE8SZL5_9PEZI|nr:uncharacterized protein DNG_08856 [Cephalotrichum gorgonifer]